MTSLHSTTYTLNILYSTSPHHLHSKSAPSTVHLHSNSYTQPDTIYNTPLVRLQFHPPTPKSPIYTDHSLNTSSPPIKSLLRLHPNLHLPPVERYLPPTSTVPTYPSTPTTLAPLASLPPTDIDTFPTTVSNSNTSRQEKF